MNSLKQNLIWIVPVVFVLMAACFAQGQNPILAAPTQQTQATNPMITPMNPAITPTTSAPAQQGRIRGLAKRGRNSPGQADTANRPLRSRIKKIKSRFMPGQS
jgi:hypothetical protein